MSSSPVLPFNLARPEGPGLSERSCEVLRRVVEAYVESGEPIGSRTISRRLGLGLSPATIRNVMSDLEESGLLYSPHHSAGRLPTEAGLRLFVSGLLEIGQLTEGERQSIDSQCAAAGRSFPQVFEEASAMLSGLSNCAGIVVAPKIDSTLRHIEFVSLAPGRALVVIVTENGQVENRIIDVPIGLPASSLIEATNYLSARLVGRTLVEARREIEAELISKRAQLDTLTARVVSSGLATWNEKAGGVLIVRGQSKLLEDVTAVADLERIRALFATLETQESLSRLLEAADHAEGVQIFIGAENGLFGLAGCSLVVAPVSSNREKVIGAVGVIGPTRINYARIIPMVDYTAQVIRRLLG
jgi:heat-inducible transcriptional repressor